MVPRFIATRAEPPRPSPSSFAPLARGVSARPDAPRAGINTVTPAAWCGRGGGPGRRPGTRAGIVAPFSTGCSAFRGSGEPVRSVGSVGIPPTRWACPGRATFPLVKSRTVASPWATRSGCGLPPRTARTERCGRETPAHAGYPDLHHPPQSNPGPPGRPTSPARTGGRSVPTTRTVRTGR